MAARRLPQGQPHERSEGEPGQAYNEESHAPAEELVDPAAGEVPDHDPNGNPQRENGERGRAALGREVVREQRMRGWRTCRLTDANAHPY